MAQKHNLGLDLFQGGRSPENERKAEELLERIRKKIEDGTFRYAEAFPGASEEEKAYFSRLEGWDYHPGAKDVAFCDYAQHWIEEVLSRERSQGKKRDFLQVISGHLIPWFGAYTFEQINGILLVKFIRDLQDRKGRDGKGLSPNRIRNVLIPLRAIWADACEEYDWDLRDPFAHLTRKGRNGKIIQRRKKNAPEIFRYSDWEKIVESINPYYRPVVELQLMTGLIASEIAGLRRQDIDEKAIHVQHSIVRGVEKDELKTEYRIRDIPITTEIGRRLEELLDRETGEYLVTMKQTDTPFNASTFRQSVWKNAIKKAGVTYRRPYAMRHTFAAWSLMLGMPPTRLVHLMGHGSKQMVFETYGKYAEGVEADIEKIRAYFGVDFG